MRELARDPAARSLNDDAAVLEIGGEALVLTHDVMAEGVHWLPDADPADVAWKLLAVNLSDLAAKGAEPMGVLLGFTLGDAEWDRAFAVGLKTALDNFKVSLIGGDTVFVGGNGRVLGMTAIGKAVHRPVPSRSGAVDGDALYSTGTLGNALAGFELAKSGKNGAAILRDAFTRPIPMLLQGQVLAPFVHAMMDLSDGLLLDASRMADASGLALEVDLAAIPLSDEYISHRGDDRQSRLAAASWGDDYQLLFAASPDVKLPVEANKVGHFSDGSGLTLRDGEIAVALPEKLGFQHG